MTGALHSPGMAAGKAGRAGNLGKQKLDKGCALSGYLAELYWLDLKQAVFTDQDHRTFSTGTSSILEV